MMKLRLRPGKGGRESGDPRFLGIVLALAALGFGLLLANEPRLLELPLIAVEGFFVVGAVWLLWLHRRFPSLDPMAVFGGGLCALLGTGCVAGGIVVGISSGELGPALGFALFGSLWLLGALMVLGIPELLERRLPAVNWGRLTGGLVAFVAGLLLFSVAMAEGPSEGVPVAAALAAAFCFPLAGGLLIFTSIVDQGRLARPGLACLCYRIVVALLLSSLATAAIVFPPGMLIVGVIAVMGWLSVFRCGLEILTGHDPLGGYSQEAQLGIGLVASGVLGAAVFIAIWIGGERQGPVTAAVKDVSVWIGDVESAEKSPPSIHLTDAPVAISPQGPSLLTSLGDRTLRLVSAQTIWNKNRSEALEARVTALALSQDSQIALAGDEGGGVYRWQPQNADTPSLLGRHNGAVTTLVIGPDGEQAVSAGADGRLLFWRFGGVLEGTLEQSASINAGAISPDGRQMVVGTENGVVRIADGLHGGWARVVSQETAAVTSLAISPDGSQLALGLSDGTVVVRRYGDGEELHRLEGHRLPIRGLAYSPEGLLLASASGRREPSEGANADRDLYGSLCLWSPETGEALDRFDLSRWQDHAVSLVFHPYEEWIFVGTAGGAVLRFRLSLNS